MNKNLTKALNKLIEKYSSSTFLRNDTMSDCPLCEVFYGTKAEDFEQRCIGCPNNFFDSNPVVSCADRARDYPALNYAEFKNYPTLKQFWVDYKELYLAGMSNEAIMSKLVIKYKNSNK